MRSLRKSILASVVTLVAILGCCPATPSESQSALNWDPGFSKIDNQQQNSICHCGHHHDAEEIERSKVDAESCPTATCAAPESRPSYHSEPLTLRSRGFLEEPSLKRVSVTALVRQALTDQKQLLTAKLGELKQWGPATQTHFVRWFGTNNEDAREAIEERIGILLKINEKYTEANFRRSENPTPGIFAYVRSNDPSKVFLDNAFVTAPAIGVNSRAGTITHEMSHFKISGGTKDHAYGEAKCRELARTKPSLALTNADNFEYFIENAR